MADKPSLTYAAARALLRRHHSHVTIQQYFESGVRHGLTMEQFLKQCWECWGVELHPGAYAACVERLGPQARLYLGDSSELMFEVLPNIPGPCLFYLDAHWWGGYGSTGAYSDNPLLSELCAIRNHHYEDFVIIDDAQAFGASPQRTKSSKIDPGWEGLTTAAVLTALGRRRVRDCSMTKGNINTQLWVSLRA